MKPHLAVVEDDHDLRAMLTRGLREEGYSVAAFACGGDALEPIAAEPPAAVVMDIGLPDADGRDVCQALRARGVTAPVLFLTARESLTDRLSGFHAGGDDYLTKPFHFDELVVRVRALVRRGQQPEDPPDGLRMDPTNHAAAHGEHRVQLTPTEFRVLAVLVARPGEVVRRRELIAAAWPDGAIVHDNTLDTYLRRLRRKLAELGGAARIATVYGVGYRLQPDGAS